MATEQTEQRIAGDGVWITGPDGESEVVKEITPGLIGQLKQVRHLVNVALEK